AITGVFLPRATQMTVANASSEELTSMMIKIGRISFIILLYILGAFILFGKQFVFLWVGEAYYDSWIIALIIMFGLTLPLTQYFGTSILEAKNNLAFKTIIYLIFLIIGTGAGAFFAKTYGGIGMITGSATGMVIAQIFLNIYYYKVIKLNILRFFKELLHKTFLSFILILTISYFINHIPGEGWLNFLLKSTIYSTIYALIIYNLGIIEYEKNLFNKSLLDILNKLKR